MIPAQLANNILLIGLILFYAFIDILAWSKNGILLQELRALKDTHNERTFNIGELRFIHIKPLLFLQYPLFFGLCLFTIVFPEPGEILKRLLRPSSDVYLPLAACIAVPLLWYLLQRFFHVWICYIFGGDTRIIILERVYKASHLLAGPIVLLIFTSIVTWQISTFISAILLIGTFIITQVIFIFCGIKIFFNGFGSLCLIFVYLCTLEIAPLVVIFTKLGLGK